MQHKSLNINFLQKLFILIFFLWSCGNPGYDWEKDLPKRTTPLKVNNFIASGCLLGESMIWNNETAELTFGDNEGRTIFQYGMGLRKLRKLSADERVGAVVPTKNPKVALLVTDQGIYEYFFDFKGRKFLAKIEDNFSNHKLNDGKCDPAGRLWVSSMELNQKEGAAALYQIDRNGTVEKKLDNLTMPDGLTWSLDAKTMYFVEINKGKVKAYDYDVRYGDLSNGRDIIDIPPSLGSPYGMTIDAEGMLWIAMWGGNAVTRWNPNTGKIMDRIEVPAHNVTSCAFGNLNLKTLYITTAKMDMTPEELQKWPLAGNVFSVDLNIQGIPSIPFNKVPK